jgi:hypothetical protein
MATTRKTARPKRPTTPTVRKARASVSKSKIERPSNVNAIGTMTIISGALNLVGGLGVSFTLGITLFGLICLPITLFPAVVGVFEIMYGVKLLHNPPQPVQPSKTIAILEIVMFLYLNVVSGVIGILALTMYTDPEVEKYFQSVNS